MSVCFAKTTAEKFGLSERHVRRLVAAGSRLSLDEVTALRAAPRPVGLKDLAEIGKIGEADERRAVVRALAAGEAKNATAARKAWMRQVHGPAAVKDDPVEAGYLDLTSRWRRAPKGAKRLFVAALAAELRGLLDDLDGGADV